MHESELLKEESAEKAAVDEAQKAAIAQAVMEAKVRHTTSPDSVYVWDPLTRLQVANEATARLLFTSLDLPTIINHSHPFTHSAEVTEAESFAIVSAIETLRGEESQSKGEIISGFFSGEGELQGVACKGIVLFD